MPHTLQIISSFSSETWPQKAQVWPELSVNVPFQALEHDHNYNLTSITVLFSITTIAWI